jgi:4-azaleucine resistance transporter AzlC
MSAKGEFLKGIGDITPILLGVIPFGMIYGVLAISADLPVDVSQAMSIFVFAGSAQFVAAQLFRVGAPGIVIILTTLIINLRHMLYSAAVAPYIKHLPWKWKGVLAFMLTDEAFAVVITHYGQAAGTEEEKPYRRWYFLGAELMLYLCWQISTAVGIVLGAQIPGSWELDFTLALTFIALVVPALKNRPQIAAAVTAGVVATAAGDWPYKLGLMAAAVIGIAVGLGLEGWLDRRPAVEKVECL